MSDALDIAVGLLSQVTKVLRKLSPEQLDQLADGSAKLAFVPPGHRVATVTGRRAASAAGDPADIAQIASALGAMESAADARRYLKSLPVRTIDEVAARLGISLPRVNKEPKIDSFAESLVGYRENAAAVMGDAYRS